MRGKGYNVSIDNLTHFDRHFFDGKETFTYIGTGELGGKAQGLAFVRDLLARRYDPNEFPQITVAVPTLAVVATGAFDSFMEENNLRDIASSDLRDDQIAHAFQKASLPPELVGDLRALISKVHTPLAIRSSSLLEDALYEPFAGVYATKMIPNNQFDEDSRFHRLTEAIKFVYASTFFKSARDYVRATAQDVSSEKMAVIIQETVGLRYGDRFYPTIAGVGRSFNYYPSGKARPEEGVVDLALGLGKTIVDGGVAYSYSPTYPNANPVYGSIDGLLDQSQNDFWAVNMGKPPEYDPIRETEYLTKEMLAVAEQDGTLRFVASTYKPQEDRIVLGIGTPGPRLVDFSPVLKVDQIPLNKLIKRLLALCQEEVRSAVEIEFAVTIDPVNPSRARFGFLQVRPMVVSDAVVDVDESELGRPDAVIASDRVMGNGALDTIRDIVYVVPETFNAANTREIALELEQMNRSLLDAGRPYLLVGFGRWGSSDPWLGIPVNWGQISGARVIVEATLPNMNVDLSQGSHFFHNISSFQVLYFCVHHLGKHTIRWDWLAAQRTMSQAAHVRHVALEKPLGVKVDGRTGRGVIIA
ncbi:MAG: PEP/pyruvate-binding domain-containing protein [Candidatus Zixiibacteriota bacterium]